MQNLDPALNNQQIPIQPEPQAVQPPITDPVNNPVYEPNPVAPQAQSPAQPEFSKKNLILIILVALFVTGGSVFAGFYYNTMKMKKNLANIQPENTMVVADQPAVQPTTAPDTSSLGYEIVPDLPRTTGAQISGKVCTYADETGNSVEYYESGEDYFLVHSMPMSDDANGDKQNFHLLASGESYYVWSSGVKDEENPNWSDPSVYTAEDAFILTLFDSSQLREIGSTPEYCQNQMFDSGLLQPPPNTYFMTAEDQLNDIREDYQQYIPAWCEACIENNSSYEDQLECFDLSSFLIQSPEETAEEIFKDNCL